MKKILKQKKGITLIALVITIIVLLILAGISISMLAGDNSILQKATDTKKITNFANLREEAQMVLLGRQTNSIAYMVNTSLKTDLEKGISGEKTVTEANGCPDTCYVKRADTEITVYEDGDVLEGKVTVWDGTSTESPKFKEFNWYIYTPAQLKFLADFVNNGNALTSEQETLISEAGYRASDVKMESTTMVYLMNNLDFGARAGAGVSEEQRWKTESNEAKKWTPIGIDNSTKKFIGIFEGNNNTIKGLYLNRTETFSGIFGNSNTIQNLSITNSYIEGTTCTGGIVGALRSGKIENCHNKNTTVILKEGNYRTVGGVVGQVSPGTEGAFKCSNTGTIIGYGIYTDQNLDETKCGGVVGLLATTRHY